MIKCVLIANLCGWFSAMPTIEEYQRLDFITKDKVFGVVEVSEHDAELIYQNRTNVRVLLPDLPPALQNEQSLYITVIQGVVKLL